MNRIEYLATEFRHAIEDAINSGEFDDDINFRRFPCGCCGYTSDLLAKYLHQHKITTWYISGVYDKEYQQHTWLQTEVGLIIDITGDQFKRHRGVLHYDKSVYVGDVDYFHSLFKTQEPIIGYQEPIIDWLGETQPQRRFRERYEREKRSLGEFCVSDFRQNQEYHVINVHGGGLFPLSKFLPGGWDGMRAVCGVNAGPAFRESYFRGISLPCGRRT